MSPSASDADPDDDPGTVNGTETPDRSGTPDGPGDSCAAGPSDSSEVSDDPHVDARMAGVVAVALLGVAFVGAATAGVLAAVGPYLVGVSLLVAVLFVLDVLKA